MGYDLVMPKANGLGDVYKAAKQAHQSGQNALDAAKQQANKDGNISEAEQSLLKWLENDPKIFDRIEENDQEIIIKDALKKNYQEPSSVTNVSFVDNSDLPASTKDSFSAEFGQSNYLQPNNKKLVKKLSNYAGKVDRQSLLNYVKSKAVNESKKEPNKEDFPIYAENRTKDFLFVLDKAKAGKSLNRDDIESIQLFISYDSNKGHQIAYEGEPKGIDGKFGFRTNAALDNVLAQFSK